MQIQLPWIGRKTKTVLWNNVAINKAHKSSPKEQHLEDKKPKVKSQQKRKR